MTPKGFAKAVLLGAVITLTARFALADPLKSDDFQLVGPDGKISARLTTSGEGTPALFFFDRQGRNRMNLSLYPEGVGGLIINDTQGQAAAILRLHGSRERPVLVFKAKGQDRMVMGLRDDGSMEPFVEPMPNGGSSPEAPPRLTLWMQLGSAVLAGYAGGFLASRKSEKKLGGMRAV